MEESVDLHEEVVKANEQTLTNLSPAEEATSKDEVEIETFLQEQKSKTLRVRSIGKSGFRFSKSKSGFPN